MRAKKDLDVVRFIKLTQVFRSLLHVLLSREQRLLLKYQRCDVMRSDSNYSSSDMIDSDGILEQIHNMT